MSDLTNEIPVNESEASVSTGPNWQDQDVQLRDLWSQNLAPPVIAEKLGRSVAAIMTRAVRLGLPRRSAPGRKPGQKRPPSDLNRNAGVKVRASKMAEAPVGDPALRICLMCLEKFQSAGRHNRICSSCKSSSEYSAGSSIPDINFKTQV